MEGIKKMITINQLSAVGHVVSQSGHEICKINKTCDGWIVRGGPLNGKPFTTAKTACNAMINHYDHGHTATPEPVEPPVNRDELVQRLTEALHHLEPWEQVLVLTSTITNDQLKKLTEMQERCIEGL